MDAIDYNQLTDEQLMALCVWREARGEGILGKRGVCHVILNRIKKGGWWGGTVQGVVLHKYQFSSFNANDPNSKLWPADDEADWLDCLEEARAALAGESEDVTSGATFYWSRPLTATPQAWGPGRETVQIGHLHFWTPLPATGIPALDSSV